MDFCNTRITGGLHSEIGLVVAVRQLRLVPGEMFKKLLGTPHRHFTRKEAIDSLEKVLSHVLGMTDKDFLKDFLVESTGATENGTHIC